MFHAPRYASLTHSSVSLISFSMFLFCGLPYDMTNPASLFLLNALSGWLPDTANGILKIFPHTKDKLHLPLFSQNLWLMLDYQQTRHDVRYVIHKIRLPKEFSPQFHTLVLRADKKISTLLINGKRTPFTQEGKRLTAEIALNFTKTNEYTILLE